MSTVPESGSSSILVVLGVFPREMSSAEWLQRYLRLDQTAKRLWKQQKSLIHFDMPALVEATQIECCYVTLSVACCFRLITNPQSWLDRFLISNIFIAMMTFITRYCINPTEAAESADWNDIAAIEVKALAANMSWIVVWHFCAAANELKSTWILKNFKLSPDSKAHAIAIADEVVKKIKTLTRNNRNRFLLPRSSLIRLNEIEFKRKWNSLRLASISGSEQSFYCLRSNHLCSPARNQFREN